MSQSCASWASFADPDDAYRQATVVFVGTVLGRDGETDTQFGTARAYRVHVEQVIKGQLSGSTVRLAPVPDNCGPKNGYFPGDDKLQGAGRVLIYGTRVYGALTTLAPAQGVVAFPAGSTLPFKH